MKYFVGCWLLLLPVLSSQACDICGCSAQSTSLGFLPGENNHFVGFRYHHRRFFSEHPPVYAAAGESDTRDVFHTYEWWGRWAPHRRLHIFAFVPVNHAVMNGDDYRSIMAGVGDISLLANVLLLDESQNGIGGRFSQNLLVGGGVKSPTGSFGAIDAERQLILPNMQPGTGSWDYLFVLNYRVKTGSYGLNINASYRYNTPNEQRYQFGNQKLITVDGFRTIETEKWLFIPQIGARAEWIGQDYSNASRGDLNPYSGGHFAFASAALDVYRSNWGLTARADLPVAQHFAQGYIQQRLRFTVGIHLLFNN